MTLIATEDIFVTRGVRAFRKGDAVPESVVANLGIRAKVVGPATKAAETARAEAVTAPGPVKDATKS